MRAGSSLPCSRATSMMTRRAVSNTFSRPNSSPSAVSTGIRMRASISRRLSTPISFRLSGGIALIGSPPWARRGVARAPHRDQGAARVADLHVGHAHRLAHPHRAPDRGQVAPARRPQVVHPHVDGGHARARLGDHRVVSRDVGQRADHPAVQPVRPVVAQELLAERQPDLHQALLGPHHLEPHEAHEGRVIEAQLPGRRSSRAFYCLVKVKSHLRASSRVPTPLEPSKRALIRYV